MASPRSHVFLIPGLFGFGTLAGTDYFGHVKHGLEARFAAAGRQVAVHVVTAPPTASIVTRAHVLAIAVAQHACHDDGPIHVLGHSTGGLDGRLWLSPAGQIDITPSGIALRERVRSLITLSTPHHGTPLAAYFTTVAGTRLLQAMSMLTVITLSAGRLPLTAFSGAVATLAELDERLGVDWKFFERMTDRLLALVGNDTRRDVHAYGRQVQGDRAGVVQLMPEVMELFNASVPDAPGVRYACIASAAPSPGPKLALRGLVSPMRAWNLALYTTLYSFASLPDARGHYGKPSPEQADFLDRVLGAPAMATCADGIVPTLSMLWGELIHVARADHLDVVGHFDDDAPHTAGAEQAPHVDWLMSGARFNRSRFGVLLDAIAAFMLRD
jgi:triacylglycerol lipase